MSHEEVKLCSKAVFYNPFVNKALVGVAKVTFRSKPEAELPRFDP